MTHRQNYSDLYFKNAQLTKLVKLAESVFESIYGEVGFDKQEEIDKWLCDKKEFDVCCETKYIDEQSTSTETFSSSESWCSSDENHTDEEDSEYSDDMNLNFTTSGFVSSSPSEWCLNESVLRSHGQKFSIEEKNEQIEKIYGPLKSPFSWDQVAKGNRLVEYPNTSCDNRAIEYRKNYSLLVNSQIENLREIRTTLLNACQKYTSHYKRCDPSFEMNRSVLLIQEVIEMMDTSIEMKNDADRLDDQILKIIELDGIVYSSLLNYLEFLTIKEIQYLLMWYLTRYIDLRENSSTSDRLILSLDNKIIQQEIKLRHLEGDLSKIHGAVVNLKSKNKYRVPNLNGIMQTLKGKQNVSSLPSTFMKNVAKTPTTVAVQSTKQDESQTYDVAKHGNKLVIEKD